MDATTAPTHCKQCGGLLPPLPDLAAWLRHSIITTDPARKRLPHEDVCFACYTTLLTKKKEAQS
jgi:hypothetical protein